MSTTRYTAEEAQRAIDAAADAAWEKTVSEDPGCLVPEAAFKAAFVLGVRWTCIEINRHFHPTLRTPPGAP